MRPAGIIGLLLIVFGAIVLVVGGVSYVKNRDRVDLGVARITTEERGFIPPWIGAVALVGGIALLATGRRRGSTI
ncbi:MAG TPA: hypothetical protein VJ755_09165 [Gemmatimonadales bacterium]|nr:hypothetical protein [Gemmatimonadales bacterium]